MTDQPPLDDEAEERKRLIAKYETTGNKAYLRAAACLKRSSTGIDRADALLLLERPHSRGRGQPSEDDHAALVAMAVLMERDGLTRNAASLKVAAETPGHSKASTTKRLNRKFRERPDEYIWFARQFLGAQKRHQEFDVLVRSIENRFHSILNIKVQ